MVNFSVPLSNKFDVLAPNNEQMTPVGSSNTRSANTVGKHPASSPLDEGQTFKKHREHSDSDTDSSAIQIDMTPQTDPPRIDSSSQRIPQYESFVLRNDYNSDNATLNIGPTMMSNSEPLQATLMTCPSYLVDQARPDLGNSTLRTDTRVLGLLLQVALKKMRTQVKHSRPLRATHIQMFRTLTVAIQHMNVTILAVAVTILAVAIIPVTFIAK